MVGYVARIQLIMFHLNEVNFITSNCRLKQIERGEQSNTIFIKKIPFFN
jgi:hypothetical protein